MSDEPLMPYEQWRALGPEKAAAYLARRRGYTSEQQGKLWAVLETFWHDEPLRRFAESNDPTASPTQ